MPRPPKNEPRVPFGLEVPLRRKLMGLAIPRVRAALGLDRDHPVLRERATSLSRKERAAAGLVALWAGCSPASPIVSALVELIERIRSALALAAQLDDEKAGAAYLLWLREKLKSASRVANILPRKVSELPPEIRALCAYREIHPLVDEAGKALRTKHKDLAAASPDQIVELARNAARGRKIESSPRLPPSAARDFLLAECLVRTAPRLAGLTSEEIDALSQRKRTPAHVAVAMALREAHCGLAPATFRRRYVDAKPWRRRKT